MPTFEQGDIVRVPFPYTDRETRQHRPALVVSAGGVGDEERLLWVVMITSAENRRWTDDLDIGANYRRLGLPAPSIVRPSKIATIETKDAGLLGRVSKRLMGQILLVVARTLALPSTGLPP
ncbi:MAG: type II toxin-antitoxin system PemK/MazF family toxin [Acetobacteraceae bacterium]